jgi:pimeloyl-ACP methyl ester carboxylesterase
MPDELPFFLLPGMFADKRLFQSQLNRFPHLQVPDWIAPRSDESLRAYAARFAQRIDPGVPCVVGGASFGGIIALEMVPHLKAAACILIGSIRSPAELSWRWRMLRPLALLGPHGLGFAARLLVNLRHLGIGRATVRRLQRLAEPEAAHVRWAMCAVLRWQPSPQAVHVPVFQIHGEFDRTLPAGNTRADVIVPGGHHALSLFNSEAVNDYLTWVMEQIRHRDIAANRVACGTGQSSDDCDVER